MLKLWICFIALIGITIAQNVNINYINHTLTESSSSLIVWLADMKLNDAYIVCSDVANNSSLELFVTQSVAPDDLVPFILYDSNGTDPTTFVSDLLSDSYFEPINSAISVPRSIKSKSNCFTLWSQTDKPIYATVLFKVSSAQNENCLQTNNVYEAGTSKEIFASAGDDSCEIIILSWKSGFDIQSITTSTNESYILKSPFNQNIFLNSEGNNTRINLVLYTPALSIVIPTNSSITLKPDVFEGPYIIEKTGCQYHKKGIISSPNFAGITNAMYDTFAYNTSFDRSNTIKFDINISKMSNVILYYGDNKSYTFTKNETFIFESDYFYIEVDEKNSGNNSFLIQYSLASILNANYIKNITFNDINPYYTILTDNIAINNAMIFCSTNNDTEVFITGESSESDFYVYDTSAKTEISFDTCFDFPSSPPSNTVPFSIQSSKGCIILYKWKNESNTARIFARSQSSQAANCVSKSNVFQLTDDSNVVTSTASSKGSCEMVLLASIHLNLSSISISIEKLENVQSGSLTFKSVITKKELFSTNASDIQYWMNFGIFTHGLIISIPKNNELTLTGKTEIDTYHIVKNGCQHIQKGVLISPSLNGLNSSLFENEILYNSTFVQNNTMNFTVNMLSGNETVELFYSGNSTLLSESETLSVVADGFFLFVNNTLTSSSNDFIITYTLTSNIYPNYNYIDLSDDNPYYLALLNEIPVNNGTIVCGLPDDVDIHVTDGTYDSLCLYDSMDLENNVEFPTSFSSISSKSGCFHLYRASNNTPPITALIRLISSQSKDCENINNVFQSTEAPNDLSATSKGNGSCEVIILASKYTPFTTISINRIGETQSDSLILKSTINSKQIVEIPAQDAKYWMNFGIHSFALTALIPQDSTVSINTNVQRNGYNIQKSACQYIQKGVIVSPGYTGMKYSDFIEVLYKSEFFQSNNMEFNAIEVSEKDEVTIRYDQSFVQSWQSNGTFSINAQKNFSVQVFKNSNVSTSDFLIEYTLTSNINLNSNNIDLNENETYYLGLLDDIPINNSIVVCAGAQNTELFITNEKYDSFCLYDSSALENNIKVGFGITSESGCFHLYRWHKNDTTAVVFIRSKADQSKNCKDAKNVFQVGTKATTTADGSGICEMIVLGGNYNEMSAILITDMSSNGDGNITLKSPVNNKLIYEIAVQDAKYWKTSGFYTYALSINIPANSDLTVNTKAQNGQYTIQKQGCDHIYKGLIASPAFTGSSYSVVDKIYDVKVDREHTVILNVLEMSESDIVLLEYFNVDGNHTTEILKNGYNFTTDLGFNITMNKTNPESYGYLIQYILISNIYPNSKTVYLSEKMPYYLSLLENINVNDLIIVCVINYTDPHVNLTNYELRLTTGSKQDFWLHDSTDLENCVNFPTGFEKMSLTRGCLNIYRFAKSNTLNTATIMIREREIHSKNCKFGGSFTTNVFQISDTLSIPSVEATENGSCEMIVVAPSYDTTTSISVDSIYRLHTYNVSLQSSTIKHTLLDVSAAETFKWQGFGIFTNALTVIVPQKNIVVLKSHVGHGAYNITKYMDGQRGIMTTPAYTGGLASTDISHFYNIKNTYNITVNIKVLDFLGSSFVVFQSQNDDKWINATLTANGTTITQNASSFGLYESEKRGEGVLLEYSFNDFFHPNLINHTLDSTNPTYPLWLDDLNVNDALTVCSNSGPLTIQVTSTNNKDALGKYRLFDSTALLNFATDLGAISSSSFSQGYMPGNFTSKSGCFTLYREPGNLTYATALFSIPSIQSKNCISEGNILQTQNPSSNNIFLFQVGASSGGPCEMIILFSQSPLPLISIENVSVSPDTNFVFKSLINQKQLFNLSSNDAAAFKKVGIYTYALSVIIPTGKIMNMLAYNSQGPYTITSDISTEKGIMASPSLNGILGASLNPLYKIASDVSLSLSISVKSLDGSLIMQNENGNTTLQNGQSTTNQGTNFNFFFINSNNANSGFLMEYTIEKTITPPSDNSGSTKIILNISVICVISFISFLTKIFI